jgi:hypothetical protein
MDGDRSFSTRNAATAPMYPQITTEDISSRVRDMEKIRVRTYLLIRIIVLLLIVILGIQITDIAYSNVQRSALYELASQEREFITSGFFPRLMDALRKSFEEQHHGPLHNILGAIGDGIQSLFGSSDTTQYRVKSLEDGVGGQVGSKARGKRSIVANGNGEVDDDHSLKYELFDLVERLAWMYLNETSQRVH